MSRNLNHPRPGRVEPQQGRDQRHCRSAGPDDRDGQCSAGLGRHHCHSGAEGEFRFPTGSPTAIARMLDFCARHGIESVVEMFPMSRVNEVLDRLRAGKVRYRVVLKNDFAA